LRASLRAGFRSATRRRPGRSRRMLAAACFACWFAPVLQASAQPASDARAAAAVDWLVAHGGDLQRGAEPLVGLTPALVPLAFAPAGELERAHALQAWLEHRADQLVSTPARALAIAALAVDPPEDPVPWRARSVAIDRLLGDLLLCQDLREWKTRRT